MPVRRHILTFNPVHFLIEAIDDFLESGSEPSKIASAVIKVATGVELLLKSKLEKICPALILEKIDPGALQVSKVFNLQKQMRVPTDLDKVELKTAKFDVLLQRAAQFVDLSKAEPHLRELHKIRNSLIHHKGEVDLWEVNLLLGRYVFPFLEELVQGDARSQVFLRPEVWKKIRQIEKASTDALSSQLAKKLTHYALLAEKLSGKQVRHRLGLAPEQMDSDEDVLENALICPACKNESLAGFGSWDVDHDDETGMPISGSWEVVMRCRVCGLRLSWSEIEYILQEFASFFGADGAKERAAWEQAIEPPEPDDYFG